MPLIPLDIPPGVYGNGTDYEASGRWRTASLVRWRDGSLRPVGGWRERISDAFSSAPRALITWEDNSGDRWIGAGAFDKLYAVTASSIVRDITPAGFTAGRLSAEVETGFGGGFYGSAFYGTARPDTGNFSEVTTWALDNWGEYLVGCSVDDGRLWEWDLDTTVGSDVVTNGEFAADSDWTKGTGWTIAAGVASFSGSAVAALSQALTVVDGETYELTFTLADAAANEARVVVTTGGGDVFNATFATGTHTVRFLVDDTTATLKFEPAAAVASAFSVDDVSATKIPVADVIGNAPINNLSLMVTEERFLFALGAGGNPRKVQWSDREDNTLWTPAATNEAGDIELQTAGQIMAGVRTRGQSLILTDIDAHSATYVGPPFVYGFERVGTACGLIARKAVAATDSGVFWMGSNGFFLYNGTGVQEIPCEVHDYVFGDINPAQISKAWATTVGQQGEVWWFYPSGASVEIDRYVAFDFKEGHWMTGELSRTAGADRGVFKYPLMTNASGDLYEHEVGLNYEGAAVYAETGPISIGTGDQVMSVTQLIPDEKTSGDVSATFKTRFYPNDTERSYGPYSMANPTSVRFTGRQVRMRVEGERLADWRVGVMRLEAKPRGLR